MEKNHASDGETNVKKPLTYTDIIQRLVSRFIHQVREIICYIQVSTELVDQERYEDGRGERGRLIGDQTGYQQFKVDLLL